MPRTATPSNTEDNDKRPTFNSNQIEFRSLVNLYLRRDEFDLDKETKPAEIRKRWPDLFEKWNPKSFQRQLAIIKTVLVPVKEHKGKTFRIVSRFFNLVTYSL